ncbi:hypothetical protein I302_106622 [Kwoniella bestiolae CBS 10118]|uniref:Uncharacterized protein n=1 Tax=Kwoniella bestiolae CBS 10118 TaxID=1296100 RepID=A0A1B9G0V5_9TREE|nr:hypothetical protein I302_06116 [Kwoniella bestiolae CBS 10118]OCF24655.1 hypothetical protein I302_06116 [Kwoniella bestiolae CBS 10118]
MTSSTESTPHLSLADNSDVFSSEDSPVSAASPEPKTNDLEDDPSEYARQAVQFLTSDITNNIASFARKLLRAGSSNEGFGLSDELASRMISRELGLSVEASENIWKAALQEVEAVLTVDDEHKGSIRFVVNDQCGDVEIVGKDPTVAALGLACTFGKWQKWYQEEEETPPNDASAGSCPSGEVSLREGDHVYQQFFGPGWSQSFTSVVHDRHESV